MKPTEKKSRWKLLVVIFIALAMPLFFSFVNDSQIQYALKNSTPETQEKINNK